MSTSLIRETWTVDIGPSVPYRPTPLNEDNERPEPACKKCGQPFFIIFIIYFYILLIFIKNNGLICNKYYFK